MPVQRPQKHKAGDSKAPKGDKETRKSSSSMYATGDAIIEKAKADAARKKMEAEKCKAGSAFRFFVPKGEEKEIVILDKSIRHGLGITQHRLKNKEGHWSRFEPCIGNDDDCPLCKGGNKATYYIMLSILDLSGYTDKKGNEVPYSKRLLAITSNQLEEFTDLEEGNNGSLRGMYLVMKRGNSDTSYSNGSPKALKGGKVFQVYSEDELVEEYGNAVKKDKKTGEVIKSENADITPFNYKKLFPEPSEEYVDALRDEFDEGNQPAGSRKSNAKSWDDDESDEPDEDEDEKPRKGRLNPGSKKPKRHADEDEESDSEDETEDEDEDERPRKSSAKKSARSRASRDDDEDESEEDSESESEDDEDEDERPAKKSKRPVRSRDEDEDEEDDSDSEDESSEDESEDEDETEDEDEDERPRKAVKRPVKKQPFRRR